MDDQKAEPSAVLPFIYEAEVVSYIKDYFKCFERKSLTRAIASVAAFEALCNFFG